MASVVKGLRAGTLPREEVVSGPAELAGQQRESFLRVGLGWLLALIGLVGVLGVSWDIQWHTQVGRDTTFTPPHLMIYSNFGATGLVALLFVLFETYRYYRHSRYVTSRNTVPVLGLFHAPLGFVITGFAVLAAVVAAPLDDYWHQLYGIDVSIWTPFHMMGIIAGIFGAVGHMYIFASEYNAAKRRQAQPDRRDRQLIWLSYAGLIFVAACWFSQLLLLVVPTLAGISITSLNIVLYPLGLALAIPAVLVGLTVATGRIGMATLVGVVFSLVRWLVIAFVPWGITYMTTLNGQSLRSGGPANILSVPVVAAIDPAYLILAGLLVDAVLALLVWRSSGQGLNKLLFASTPATLLLKFWPLAAASIVAALAEALLEQPYAPIVARIKELGNSAQVNTLNAERVANLTNHPPNLLVTLPFVALLALAGCWLGRSLGAILRYGRR